MRSNALWLMRLYYFVFVGAGGFTYPFLNLFYNQKGLNGVEIGLVLTAGSIVGLVASPLWGRWNDAGGSSVRLLQFGLFASSLALIVLSRQSLFASFALFASLNALASAGIGPLSDALALRVTSARRAGYGSVRVFGSAGWAVSVLVGGWLIEQTSLAAGLLGNAAGFFAAALLLLGLAREPARTLLEQTRERTGLRTAVRELVRTRALFALALALIARGILSDGHQQFGNLYLEQLGASTKVIGIASMLASVVELPGMFLADRVLRKIGSTNTLLFSFFITGSKLILVLVFPAVWSVLVTRAVEGLAYSLFVIGVIGFVTAHVSRTQTATMLALFTVTLTALIQILASPLGGIVFDAVGAYWLFALALVGNFLALVILWSLIPKTAPSATGSPLPPR
jgi:MFS transporter, PPP family, 3-phenylpropionic acid transporter